MPQEICRGANFLAYVPRPLVIVDIDAKKRKTVFHR